MGIAILSRMSVKTAKVLMLVVFMVNVVYFALYNDSTTAYISNPMFKTGSPSEPSSLNQQSLAFSQHLAQMFKMVEEDKNKYWLAHTELTETNLFIQIKEFLRNQLPNAWVNRNDLFYDPRFTLSILMSELKTQYLKSKTVKAGKTKLELNKVPRPTIPFNWADWMDLTVLNEQLKKPQEERMSCSDISKETSNHPNPSYFCMEPSEYAKDPTSFIKLGYSSITQFPGFIIHDHSKHDDRPVNDIRVLEAKSYAMTHLPNPYRVIILNGDETGGTFEFDVDVNDTRRLIATDLVDSFLRNHGLEPEEIDDATTLQISHITEYESLKKEVVPMSLSPSQDIHGMYGTLRKQQDGRSSRELVLDADLFVPSSVRDQINYYEQKNAVPVNKLSRFERNFYDGLKECAKYNDANEPTFFKMATIRVDDDRNRDREWGWHYDWRFFNGALNYNRDGWSEQELIHRTNIILDRLLRNWNRFAEEKGIVSWVMHGPLLSWYWDGLMFPFDLDIDIQMPVSELTRLAREYNQTLVVEDPQEGYGKYLIEVGSYIHNRGISGNSNHIDARFIDVDSGIYIDITGLSQSKADTPSEYKDNSLADIEKGYKDGEAQIYNDRRKHFYKLEQLSPLRYSMMGGVPVFVPSTITNRLIFEYSNGLSSYEYNNWYYVTRLNLWITKNQVASVFDDAAIRNENGDIDRDKLLASVQSMTEEQTLVLLKDDDILVEYYLTKDLTDTHEKEKQFLFDSLGKDNTQLNSDEALKQEYNQLTSTFKMSKPLRKALYDYESLERLNHHKD